MHINLILYGALCLPISTGALSAEEARLITNSYAYHSPDAPDSVKSPDWEVTAGSLFLKGDRFWSGNPDHEAPDAHSAKHTESAVFRAVLTKKDFKDVDVHVGVEIVRFISTPTTPAESWDGVHIFLRYQSQYSLYYASIVRRDGTVVIKFTPGHTPGHQSLFLKLAKTGPIVLSGDLYHYPEEMKLKVVPGFDFNKEQTAKSREMLEAFAKSVGAPIWIQHDVVAGAKLKKAPEYYD